MLTLGFMSADLERVVQLLAERKLSEARELLDAMPSEPAVDVRRIQLELYDGTLPAGAAMQRLLQIMRKDQHTPGAKDLYIEASGAEYQGGRSSMTHSHPPPPVRKD